MCLSLISGASEGRVCQPCCCVVSPRSTPVRLRGNALSSRLKNSLSNILFPNRPTRDGLCVYMVIKRRGNFSYLAQHVAPWRVALIALLMSLAALPGGSQDNWYYRDTFPVVYSFKSRSTACPDELIHDLFHGTAKIFEMLLFRVRVALFVIECNLQIRHQQVCSYAVTGDR